MVEHAYGDSVWDKIKVIRQKVKCLADTEFNIKVSGLLFPLA